MCDPATLGLLLAATSTALTYENERQSVRDQNRATRKQARLASENFQRESNALQLQANQQRSAAAAEKFRQQVQAAEIASRARTSSGEAGVSGLSVDALLNDFELQSNAARQVLDTNFEIQMLDFQESLAARNAVAARRSLERPLLPGPDPVLAGVSGAAHVFNTGVRTGAIKSSPGTTNKTN